MRSREAADHVSGLMRHVRSRVSEFDLRFFSRAHRSKFHLLERDTTVPALKEMKYQADIHSARALCPRIAHALDDTRHLLQLGPRDDPNSPSFSIQNRV